MLNQYPWWKSLLIGLVGVIGLLYALPNLFGENEAVQISPARAAVTVDQALYERVEKTLKEKNISIKAMELDTVQRRLLVRFQDPEAQLKAADLLKETLGRDYVVALNLAPATPAFLRALGLRPMYLGLDLRGGVYFLMQVDMNAALKQAEETYVDDVRVLLRDEKIRYVTVDRAVGGGIRINFKEAAERDKAIALLKQKLRNLQLSEIPDGLDLKLALSEQEIKEKRDLALQQNLTTLRNRINELGVSEPLIQRQGADRIVVQLPGVQDTARAKEILGATATLEFRLVDTDHEAREIETSGRAPVGSRLYHDRQGRPVLLQKRVMLTGDYIADAASGLEQQNGQPAVFVTLNSQGANRMEEGTKDNIGKPMAVVFIENKTETRLVDGELRKSSYKVEEVISVATIRDRLGKRFQITGLDTEEARNLALLLRAGALAAPVEIIEERTVGPSAGQENIDQGKRSAYIALVLIWGFMWFYYRQFGFISGVALLFHVILIIAALSLLQATLTLPGIAGIVLTMGMAVDANVLIYERIREELKLGNTPQAAIHAGFERAFGTILDSNVTTLIAAVLLFFLGSGPVKGFAVTLTLGTLTTIFTAVTFGRAIINYFYGGRRLEGLSV
jgi:preprotein translocase subunit SecD